MQATEHQRNVGESVRALPHRTGARWTGDSNM